MKEFSVSCWACPYDADFWYATDPVSESSGLMSSFGGSGDGMSMFECLLRTQLSGLHCLLAQSLSGFNLQDIHSGCGSKSGVVLL